jgi:GNAT superfamily N-acetyltransferase
MNLEIKSITRDDKTATIKLVYNVFMQFEASDYSQEGIDTFMKTVLYNNEFYDSLELYGSYIKNELVGVIATRSNGNHIALFFVKAEYQNQGIGKALFYHVVGNSTKNEITVNSSPYAVKVYHRFGFVDTDTEQLSDGIRYTPMIYRK